MIRFFDFFLSLLGLIVLSPILGLIWLIIWFDDGSPLFLQERVGRNRNPFLLIKFRSMRKDMDSMPTHLAKTSDITKFGSFLRRSKLDEMPQLWNVLKGEMSLVGPRPCLYSQRDLIAEREARSVFTARPGITGLAQIKGVDMATPKLLAEIDATMLEDFGLGIYFTYIIRTVVCVGPSDRLG